MLPNNKEGSLRRLPCLNRKLEHQELTDQYAEIIEGQKKEGVVERAENSTYHTNLLSEPQQNQQNCKLCTTLQQEPSAALHP